MLMLDEQDDAGGYQGRVEALRRRNLLPVDFDDPPQQGVLRGTIASVLVRMLEIDGGVTMRLIGPHPRYALREIQYLGLPPVGSPHRTLTGSQFVSLIGRAEDYRRSEAAPESSGEAPLETMDEAPQTPEEADGSALSG
jgi:hypothetical protein